MGLENKHGLTVRGDSEYCPLPVSIESYWWCEPNCLHCFFRGLNHVWGKDLRPISLKALENKLRNGLKNTNPQSILAHVLSAKKTIRIGNKADPFQPCEREYLRSTGAMNILRSLNWSFIVQTRFTNVLEECGGEQIRKAHKKNLITILPIISPGLEKDWELFEQKNTPTIEERIKQISIWVQKGIPLGVNGEPFIPGFHTEKDFENTLKLLKSAGIKSYNTYNFHFTPHVAKRIVNVSGVDIEKIWEMNQDFNWKPIQRKLVELAKKHDIILGCPDFVNSGMDYIQRCNTCCGINVPNPCTYNSHFFKRLKQKGIPEEEILERTWDGSAEKKRGEEIVQGPKNKNFYTLKDCI